MKWEKHSLEPLMTQLRNTRERLLAIGTEHLNAKQVKALADTEASLLARLIVANARMQSKIFNVLSAEHQKKLSDLERTHGALTSDGKRRSDYCDTQIGDHARRSRWRRRNGCTAQPPPHA